MNTKTCKNCGWVFPITQPGRTCLICGATLDVIVCTTCKTPTPIELMEKGTSTCKKCAAAYQRKIMAKQRQKLDDQFNEWVSKIRSVPKDYPTLTEQQWLEACSFFGGCARCSSDDIDTRGFFIGPTLGGRYCDWNVIPLCERCASRWDLSKSVFKYVKKYGQEKRTPEYYKCLTKITEYLGGKLDAATKYVKEAAKLTDGSK